MEYPLGIVIIPIQHGRLAAVLTSSGGLMMSLFDSDVLGIYCLLHYNFHGISGREGLLPVLGGMEDV